MDESTTAAPTDGGVEPTTQPAQVDQQAAATPQEPVVQSAQVDETAEWLKSKGLDPEAPDYQEKLVKMAYNQEKLMTKATQEASELKKSMSQPSADPSQDGINEFIADYRREKLINNFKETHADWKQYDKPMGELLIEEVPTAYGTFSRRELVNAGLMSLEDVYVMAKGKSFNVEAVKDATKQETLQQLANTQRAGGANTNATASNPRQPEVDPIMEAIKKSREG